MSTDNGSFDGGEHAALVRKAFGVTLRVALADAGMNKKTLARQAGLSEGLVINYTKGRQAPRLNEFERVAAALGVDSIDLYRQFIGQRDRIRGAG
ncbi:helix-turn-helix domain-containing protein [Promicromonospora sp. NPDC060271]|uniref:helix-turn-helix domain-containing protein n=1 Tax=Promicromonospora sp. NPDC060271 TaxID=3347089 RepID=UPI00364A0A4F